MTMGERIKQLRGCHHLTLEEVGNRVGVGKSTVRKWESGEIANMRRDKIAKLADALDTTPAYLMGWEESPAKEQSLLPGLLPVKHKSIPLVGGIAAGEPIYSPEDAEVWIASDDDQRCDFALLVKGDSMIPTYQDGDIVFVRKQSAQDYEGQIVALWIGDGAALKHVYHTKNGVQLVSDNPKYAPMVYSDDDADGAYIIGVPIGFFRRV